MSLGTIKFTSDKSRYYIQLEGEIRLSYALTLEELIDKINLESWLQSIIIDMSNTVIIDSTVLGILTRMAMRSQKKYWLTPVIISTKEDITHTLVTMGIKKCFILIEHQVTPEKIFNDPMIQLKALYIHEEKQSKTILEEKVLNAHQTLSTLNSKNKLEFQGLIDSIKQQRAQKKQSDFKKLSSTNKNKKFTRNHKELLFSGC